MTAYPTAPAWYIVDLRETYDQCVEIKDGILYRKGNTLQVWWTHDSLGNSFTNPVDGRETWTMPSVSDAKKSFDSKWICEHEHD